MHRHAPTLATETRRARSVEEQVERLRHRWGGETAVIVTCGPSLSTVPPGQLRRSLNGFGTIAVKQAIDVVQDQADFHCWNSYNVARFGAGGPSTLRCLVAEATGRMMQWNRTDLVFPQFPSEGDLGRSLAVRRNFDDFLLDHCVTRPFGPGIMYELVLYLAVHLAVAEIITVGWDISSPSGAYTHFYSPDDDHNRGSVQATGPREAIRSRSPEFARRIVRGARTARSHYSGRVYNRTKPLPGELDTVATSTASAVDWLMGHGVRVRAVTTSDQLDRRIERLTPEDLFDHLASASR